jgi:hypothetical protein
VREPPWVDALEVLPVMAVYFRRKVAGHRTSPAVVPKEIDLIDPKSLLRVGPETVRGQR